MNEIITFGQGYKLSPGIKTFIRSAKKVCNTVTVICTDLAEDVISFLNEHEVKIVDGKELAEKYNVKTTLSPYTLKMIYFYLYCKHVCNAENVYLCDFTDLCFQKNPFELIKNGKPYITSENSIIGKCQTNSVWLVHCYNQDLYSIVAKYEILNGGNIFGKKNSVVDLLKEMCHDMTLIISRIGNYQNIDQACLIKTVYFDRLRYNILNNYEIFNLANNTKAIYEQAKSTIKLNGKVPYVIHQYDAIKLLEKHLFETYGK